ncbi:MAG: hypothetical protein M3P94_06950 [Chloroflexota bacterium]|nr:hypothetical protein [Chloroflexota bacterium]
MAHSYGTLGLLDTLATIDKDNVFTYGEDTLYGHLNDLLNVHNSMVDDMTALLVRQTTEKIVRYGTAAVTGEMVEVDEYGHADVQKTNVAGTDVGFPLRAYQFALGWTRRYFEKKTVADLAMQYIAAQDADINNVRRQILRALTVPTNRSFVDRLDNSMTLPLKALINADGSSIPMSQYGGTFNGATHTHYLARVGASLAASDVEAAVDTVVEHQLQGGEVVILINKAQEATIGALPLFTPLQSPMIDQGPGSTLAVANGPRLNPYQVDDRQIGIWDGYVPVWTKPWVPSGYIFVVVVGARERVLGYRVSGVAGDGVLRLIADHEHHPLRANHFEREFGISVWNRLAASVLYTNGTVYTAPVIT